MRKKRSRARRQVFVLSTWKDGVPLYWNEEDGESGFQRESEGVPLLLGWS